MSERPRVLVGFAEALAGIESAWCLADAGYDVVAFARAGRRPALAASRGITVVAVPAPERDADGCLAAIRALVSTMEPSVVLPMDDTAVWLCAQLDGDVVVAGPAGEQARLALDKGIQVGLAEKAGLVVPPTAVAPAEPGSGPGPWMVKPAHAVVYRDGRVLRPTGRIAASPVEVADIAAGLPCPALVQPVLTGIGEGVFGYAVDGEAVALSAHRRVRMMNPRGSGSSACRSIPVDPELVEPVRRFIAASGWRGIFMVELLRDADGTPWFMELNGRVWGSLPLALKRGLAYPAWAVRGALEPGWRPPAVPAAPHVLARHLGREIVHLLAVLRGARGTDAGRWPGRGETLRALLRRERGTRWYNARRGNLGVLVRDTWRTVADQVRR